MKLRNRAVPLVLASLLIAPGCKGSADPLDPSIPESTQQVAGEPLTFQGRVSDAAGILPPDAEKRLTEASERLEKRTKHQLAIATTPSLGGEDISAYATALGNRWGIGRKGKNDGIIVLVAPNERKVRIAVGDGLTDQIPDQISLEIIERDMVPRFREGNYGAGIEAGVSAFATRLN